MKIELSVTFAWIEIICLLAAIVVAYWFILRPVLRKVPQLSAFYTQADAVEAGWFARFKGWRTIIWSRIQGLMAAVVAAIAGLYQFIQPLFADHAAELQQIIPASWWPWIIVGLLGLGSFVGEKLRKATTGPVPTSAAQP